MAFCGICGTKVDDDKKFCPGCGASMQNPVEPTTESIPEQTVSSSQQTASSSNTDAFAEKMAAFNNTTDNTADFDKTDIEQNKIMGILAYLSWLVLIPIFAAPRSKFARYHANQGLVLGIVEVIWWILQGILSTVLYSISWRLGHLGSTAMSLVNLVFLVVSVIGILNALNGRAKDLPIIGKVRLLK